jgi:hypothetical protein
VAAGIQAKVFQCAADIVGGRRRLCERLDVSGADLSRWLSNQQTSPLPVFFRALDIVLASERGFRAIFRRAPGATLH